MYHSDQWAPRFQWPSGCILCLPSVPDLTPLQTALHFAASKNNLDVAKKLIEQKATARVKDKRGTLPLHRAAAVGSVPMVQLLLDVNSPVNATDMSGLTALHHCE